MALDNYLESIPADPRKRKSNDSTGRGVTKGKGTQPPSLLSPPGPGSVRLCNAMEAKLPHSPSLPHPAS